MDIPFFEANKKIDEILKVVEFTYAANYLIRDLNGDEKIKLKIV